MKSKNEIFCRHFLKLSRDNRSKYLKSAERNLKHEKS
jgi:hypothetical protein